MNTEGPTSFTLGRYYPYRPAQVWDAVLSREFILADWAFEVHMPAVETGRSFSVKSYPIPGTEYSGNIDCEFLDVVPAEVMAFRLNTVGGPRVWTSYVTWTLQPEGRGTRVRYAQSGFDPHRPGHVRMRYAFEVGMSAALRRLGKILDARALSS